MADAFVELVFPPGGAFQFAGFVPFFLNAFGVIRVGVDVVEGFGGQEFYLP